MIRRSFSSAIIFSYDTTLSPLHVAVNITSDISICGIYPNVVDPC